jgi:hypothetical protein
MSYDKSSKQTKKGKRYKITPKYINNIPCDELERFTPKLSKG